MQAKFTSIHQRETPEQIRVPWEFKIITGIYTFRTWILWVDWNRQMGCLPLWRSATSSPSFTIPCFCTWKPKKYIAMIKMWSNETYLIWIFGFRKSSCQWNLALYGKNTGWIMDSIYSSPYGLTQFNNFWFPRKLQRLRKDSPLKVGSAKSPVVFYRDIPSKLKCHSSVQMDSMVSHMVYHVRYMENQKHICHRARDIGPMMKVIGVRLPSNAPMHKTWDQHMAI